MQTTITCIIVPHTEYRFCIPVPCTSLLAHTWQLSFLTPTRDHPMCQCRTSSRIAWTVFKFCPRPSRDLFHLVFPVSPFTLDVGVNKFKLGNYIFWSKFPKHPFWSLLQKRLPGVCSQTTALGRSRFDDSTDSRCANAREGSVEAQKCCQTDEVHHFQIQQVWNENILQISVTTLSVFRSTAGGVCAP